MQTTLNVKGMTCNHCKMAVNNAVTELEGVSGVDVNLDKGTVTVDYDESVITLATISDAIEEEGYTVA